MKLLNCSDQPGLQPGQPEAPEMAHTVGRLPQGACFPEARDDIADPMDIDRSRSQLIVPQRGQPRAPDRGGPARSQRRVAASAPIHAGRGHGRPEPASNPGGKTASDYTESRLIMTARNHTRNYTTLTDATPSASPRHPAHQRMALPDQPIGKHISGRTTLLTYERQDHLNGAFNLMEPGPLMALRDPLHRPARSPQAVREKQAKPLWHDQFYPTRIPTDPILGLGRRCCHAQADPNFCSSAQTRAAWRRWRPSAGTICAGNSSASIIGSTLSCFAPAPRLMRRAVASAAR